MSSVKIFWDPQGIALDALGSKKYLDQTDGDTPYISMSIRMLSVDAPEVHYPGTKKPSSSDGDLAQLATWIQEGKAPVSDEMAAYLYPKLATGAAGTLQEQQGIEATNVLKALIADHLTLPGGKKRNIFVRTANQPFDEYGRLLAYFAPNYGSAELAVMTPKDRATFNLLLVETGWAASFPIYPSLPRHSDLVLLYEAALSAWEAKRGAWADPLALAGYEFRMCIRLFELTEKMVKTPKSVTSADRESWVYRYCMDMTTREIVYPADYIKIPPPNRIFIWAQDVSEAVARLNLVPAGSE